MPRTIIDTPIGTLALHSWDDRLVQIRWASGADDGGEPPSSADARDPVLADACRQLRAFFDRKLTRFDLPLAPSPSPRGEALRAAIAAIPYGQTASYGAVARIAGSGPRGLGQAGPPIPFPLLIPRSESSGVG